MWREVRRTFSGIPYIGTDVRDAQIPHEDTLVRELEEGDVIDLGDHSIGSRFRAEVINDSRVSIRATNTLLGSLRISILDTERNYWESVTRNYLGRFVDRQTIRVTFDLAREQTLLEWYPKPETPTAQETQESPREAVSEAPAEQVPVETTGLGFTDSDRLRRRRSLILRAIAGDNSALSDLLDPNLKSGSLSPEAGQALAERQKYPTLPPHLQVRPSISEGQDPRPREYYTGNRGSGFPVLPPSFQTRRMPGDHRPPGYHEGGPGPVGLPPWAQPPKGPIGR